MKKWLKQRRRALDLWLAEHYLPARGYQVHRKDWFYYDQDGLKTRHNVGFLSDPRFVAAYERGARVPEGDYPMHWRIHVALWVGRMASHLPGDFVECGVNHGRVSSAILADLDWAALGKHLYLLDTFTGPVPEQFSEDERRSGKAERHLDWEYGKLEDVRRNFAEWPRVHLVPGRIPETLGEVPSERVAFVHIDMNCAAPEVAAAHHFWPRLVPGGWVLLDDYAFEGYDEQKQAMDGFAREVGAEILSLPTGQGLIQRPVGGASGSGAAAASAGGTARQGAGAER